MRKPIIFDAAKVAGQIEGGQSNRRVTVGRLMDDFRAEWRRRKRGAADGTTEEPFEKAPDDFDPRKAFA